MADKIYASIARRRDLIEGRKMQGDLHNLISRYAQARLYRETGKIVEDMGRRIVRLMAREYFPYAQAVGKAAASPILEAMGGRSLLEKGSTFRGRVLSQFKAYSRKNLLAFRAQLAKELGTLGGEVEAAFAEGFRDGKARKRIIQDLVESHRDELKRLKIVREEIGEATGKLRAAEGRLGRASKRKAVRVRKEVRKARAGLTKAKGKIRTTKDFYARFETRVQGHARDAIRREAEAAQTSAFHQAGFARLAWVAVNGSDACPSCSARHGRVYTEAQARADGPGKGGTYCGDACMCLLVPESYMAGNESLAEPLRAA